MNTLFIFIYLNFLSYGYTGACSLGAAQECFEKAVVYTKVIKYMLSKVTIIYLYFKERKQFSKSISSNQAIQFMLSDMAGKLVTSRLLLRNSATLLDSGSPVATQHCALAKQVSDVLVIIILFLQFL
jgi:alkylation response protein AidB-like acyl-CoA dehydrogenase